MFENTLKYSMKGKIKDYLVLFNGIIYLQAWFWRTGYEVRAVGLEGRDVNSKRLKVHRHTMAVLRRT